jgi:hypothetical protein
VPDCELVVPPIVPPIVPPVPPDDVTVPLVPNEPLPPVPTVAVPLVPDVPLPPFIDPAPDAVAVLPALLALPRDPWLRCVAEPLYRVPRRELVARLPLLGAWLVALCPPPDDCIV